MFATSFEYYRAGSVAEAHKLWKQHPDAKVLAGGHSLIPLLKLRLAAPSALIDIGRIKALRGIKASGKRIRIGALTTHAELAASAALTSACPMLAEAAAQIGDPQVRNCGTIGGNIAHADPASDLPAVLLALDAILTVVGPRKERTIKAADFFQGMLTTALGDREILTSIDVPAATAGQSMAYAKFSHPASRYAVLGAAAVVSVKGGTCTAARVAIGGLVPATVRAGAVEAALVGAKPTADAIARAAALVSKSLGDDVLEDVYASASYRKAMAPVYVRRALTAAFERAK
jgi:carbon-monoxide dehydrogenase medium subunit